MKAKIFVPFIAMAAIMAFSLLPAFLPNFQVQGIANNNQPQTGYNVVYVRPQGASYPVGSLYPTGPTFVRMRVVGGNGGANGWTSPKENAQQILNLISLLKPNVLERMTTGVLTSQILNQQVPVENGFPSMTYLQLLNDATQECGCVITPRLDSGGINSGIANFENQAQELYNTPVNTHFEILSIDNWQANCKSDPNFDCSNCAWVQSIFQPLYNMGWKGVGVLEGSGASGYYSTCGWSTYVAFDSTGSFTIDHQLLSTIKSDKSVQSILLYSPDFPKPAQNLQNDCGSSNSTGFYSCTKAANVLTSGSNNQETDGYYYVYPVEQAFWDSTRMFTSGGESLCDLMLNLISPQSTSSCVDPPTTTSTTTTSTTSSSSTSSSSSSSSSSIATSSSSSASTSTVHQAQISISCNSYLWDYGCTARAMAGNPPGGRISFSISPSNGGTLGRESCTTQSNTLTCSVTFTPEAIGTLTMTATYSGDQLYASASAETQINYY